MSKLHKLIERQRKDDESNIMPDSYGVGSRTITRLPERGEHYLIDKSKQFDINFVYLEGQTWIGAEHEAYDQGRGACPICQGRKLKYSELCLCCNKSGSDGKIEFSGRPIGKYINEGWEDDEPVKPKGTKYVKGELKGGIG